MAGYPSPTFSFLSMEEDVEALDGAINTDSNLAIEWSSVPIGLEQFAGCTILTVRQEEDEIEYFGNGGYIRRNCYNVFDQADHRLFHVLETTGRDEKKIHGNKRHYTITIYNTDGTQVLTIHRNSTCMTDGVDCYLGSSDIQLGFIQCSWKPFFMKNHFKVVGDMTKPTEPALLIEDGGWCSREFPILAADDKTQSYAYISKRLTAKEGYNDADVFVLEFKGSAELHPIYKALLLSSIFFIDFKYFEETREKKKDDKPARNKSRRKKKEAVKRQ